MDMKFETTDVGAIATYRRLRRGRSSPRLPVVPLHSMSSISLRVARSVGYIELLSSLSMTFPIGSKKLSEKWPAQIWNGDEHR